MQRLCLAHWHPGASAHCYLATQCCPRCARRCIRVAPSCICSQMRPVCVRAQPLFRCLGTSMSDEPLEVVMAEIRRRAANGMGAPPRQPDSGRQPRSAPDRDPGVKVHLIRWLSGSNVHTVAHVGCPLGIHATRTELPSGHSRVYWFDLRRSGVWQGPPAMGRQLAMRAPHTGSTRPPCPPRSMHRRGCRLCQNRRPRGRRPSTWPARPATARCLFCDSCTHCVVHAPMKTPACWNMHAPGGAGPDRAAPLVALGHTQLTLRETQQQCER